LFQDKHKGLCTLLYRERYGTVHPFSLCVVTHLHVACWIENNCESKFILFMWFALTFSKILMFWLHVSQHDRDWEICILWWQALINGRDPALSSSLRSPVHIQNQFNHMLAFKVWSIRHTKLITYPHSVLMLKNAQSCKSMLLYKALGNVTFLLAHTHSSYRGDIQF
jgi:hypothetical protein